MLNEKQKAFAEEYAICREATAAAVKAGYEKSSASNQGSRLLKNEEVKAYIAELIEKSRSDKIATIEEVMIFLTATMNDTGNKIKDRIKAAHELKEALTINGVNGSEDEVPNFTFQFSDTSIDDNSGGGK